MTTQPKALTTLKEEEKKTREILTGILRRKGVQDERRKQLLRSQEFAVDAEKIARQQLDTVQSRSQQETSWIRNLLAGSRVQQAKTSMRKSWLTSVRLAEMINEAEESIAAFDCELVSISRKLSILVAQISEMKANAGMSGVVESNPRGLTVTG